MPTTPEEESLGALVAQASDHISTLVRSEIELAKAELRFDAKRVGTAGGMFAAAAFMAHLCLILGSFAMGFLLSQGMWTWLAFALTGLVYLASAAGAGYLGLLGAGNLSGEEPQRPVAFILAGLLFLEIAGLVGYLGYPYASRWVEALTVPQWVVVVLIGLQYLVLVAVLGFLANRIGVRLARGVSAGTAFTLTALVYLGLVALFGYLGYPFVFQLAAGLPESAAFIIVTVFYLVVAGILVFIGVRRLKGLAGMKRTTRSLKGLKEIATPEEDHEHAS